jgi:hypothetical protein
MDEEKHNPFVDDLLDASLLHYGSVTPRPGLDARILARARAAQQRRTRFVWAGWLVAGAATALMAIGVLKFPRRQSIPMPATPAGTVTSVKVPDVGPRPTSPMERTHVAARAISRPGPRPASLRPEDEPHQPVFPSPQQETAEEKMMLQYVRSTAPTVLAAVAAESAEIPELEFKDLDISPLMSEDGETNNKE